MGGRGRKRVGGRFPGYRPPLGACLLRRPLPSCFFNFALLLAQASHRGGRAVGRWERRKGRRWRLWGTGDSDPDAARPAGSISQDLEVLKLPSPFFVFDLMRVVCCPRIWRSSFSLERSLFSMFLGGCLVGAWFRKELAFLLLPLCCFLDWGGNRSCQLWAWHLLSTSGNCWGRFAFTISWPFLRLSSEDKKRGFKFLSGFVSGEKASKPKEKSHFVKLPAHWNTVLREGL